MIEFNNVYLRAIDNVEPDQFITSDEIESELKSVYDRLKLPYGRIEMQTGVQSRGVYTNKQPSDIAAAAGKNLLSKHKVLSEEIDLLIYCGVCRDYLEPSTASAVHHHLRLKESCPSFDLSNACLGIMSGIEVAAKFLESGAYHNILLVTGENSAGLLAKTIETLKNDPTYTRKTIKKFFANFTIGSAGVALCLTSNKQHGIAKFNRVNTISETSSYKLCQGDSSEGGLVMETDSEKLMQQGIALAKRNWSLFFDAKYEHYICHQVGIHHRDFLYQNLELDLSKDTSTFPLYGNTGSAALPLTLFKARDKFKANDRIALLGIGSGLHTSVMEMLWI